LGEAWHCGGSSGGQFAELTSSACGLQKFLEIILFGAAYLGMDASQRMLIANDGEIRPARDLMRVSNADKLNMMTNLSLRIARCPKQCGIRGKNPILLCSRVFDLVLPVGSY
jgi:hypothetical protein